MNGPTERHGDVAALVDKASQAHWRLETDEGELSITERNRLLGQIQDAFADLVDLEAAGQPEATGAVDHVAGWI